MKLNDIVMSVSLAAAVTATGLAMYSSNLENKRLISENKRLERELDSQRFSHLVDSVLDHAERDREFLKKMQMYHDLKNGKYEEVKQELKEYLDKSSSEE